MSWSAINPSQSRACNCVGPQNGNPVCPCMMPAYRERKAKDDLWNAVHGKKGETPAEKAQRIGVPLIPAKIAPKTFPENPVISVCGACGMEMRSVMGYVCGRSDCPCFPQVTC